jgi:hypothetical protein
MIRGWILMEWDTWESGMRKRELDRDHHGSEAVGQKAIKVGQYDVGSTGVPVDGEFMARLVAL